MSSSQNLHNKSFNIGTSRLTYMVFAISAIIIFYLVAFLAPSMLTNVWSIIIICILYCIVLLYIFIKGEKLIITANSILIEGCFRRNRTLIREIRSYKIMASSYTGNQKVIKIYTKNEKTTTINGLPNSDFDQFIDWLKKHIKKQEELEINHVQKKINPKIPNPQENLKTYKVGKKFLNFFLVYISIMLFLTALIVVLMQNYSNSNNVLMYTQICSVVFVIIGCVIYFMFYHDRIIITKNSLIYKGLIVNKELKFNEIKGYKIERKTFNKRFQYIEIVSIINKKNIKIRPTGKIDFIELSNWIEKNLKKIE